jgi:hypothetical protein
LQFAAANAPKVYLKTFDKPVSFTHLHKLASRATPFQLMEYNHAPVQKSSMTIGTGKAKTSTRTSVRTIKWVEILPQTKCL